MTGSFYSTTVLRRLSASPAGVSVWTDLKKYQIYENSKRFCKWEQGWGGDVISEDSCPPRPTFTWIVRPWGEENILFSSLFKFNPELSSNIFWLFSPWWSLRSSSHSPFWGWHKLPGRCSAATQSSQRWDRSVCGFLRAGFWQWGSPRWVRFPDSFEGDLPSIVRWTGLRTRQVISSRKLENRTFSSRNRIFLFPSAECGLAEACWSVRSTEWMNSWWHHRSFPHPESKLAASRSPLEGYHSKSLRPNPTFSVAQDVLVNGSPRGGDWMLVVD